MSEAPEPPLETKPFWFVAGSSFYGPSTAHSSRECSHLRNRSPWVEHAVAITPHPIFRRPRVETIRGRIIVVCLRCSHE